MTWVWWVLGAVVVVWLLDRLALWAEGKGWLYWRRRRGTGSANSNVARVNSAHSPSVNSAVPRATGRRRSTRPQRSAH